MREPRGLGTTWNPGVRLVVVTTAAAVVEVAVVAAAAAVTAAAARAAAFLLDFSCSSSVKSMTLGSRGGRVTLLTVVTGVVVSVETVPPCPVVVATVITVLNGVCWTLLTKRERTTAAIRAASADLIGRRAMVVSAGGPAGGILTTEFVDDWTAARITACRRPPSHRTYVAMLDVLGDSSVFLGAAR